MKIFMLGFCCLAFAFTCEARIITVDQKGPADFSVIQDALDDANRGDTVLVRPGTYYENVSIDSQEITLTSTDPNDPNIVATTIIDGNEAGLVIGAGGRHVITGFTIQNGRGREAYGGGGPYSCGGVGFGGLLSNCRIINNHGDDPAAIRCDTSFEPTSGEPIYVPIIRNCLIQNNSKITDYWNGSIISGYAAEIDNCQIIDNNNTAIWLCAGTVKNSTISGNQGPTSGGIFYFVGWPSWPLEVTNCTITGNQGDSAGGIFCEINNRHIPNLTVQDSIIYDNRAPNDVEVAIQYDTKHYYFEPSFSFNNIKGGFDNIDVYYLSPDPNYPEPTIDWGPNNVDVDPCFVSPGYWQSQASAEGNEPVWIQGDYHLKSQSGRWDANSKMWVVDDVGSLCIDAGDPNSDWRSELWRHGSRANIGAYGGTTEASMSESDQGSPAELVVDGTVNLRDFAEIAKHWQDRQPLLKPDMNRDMMVDEKDLRILAENWLWQE